MPREFVLQEKYYANNNTFVHLVNETSTDKNYILKLYLNPISVSFFYDLFITSQCKHERILNLIDIFHPEDILFSMTEGKFDTNDCLGLLYPVAKHRDLFECIVSSDLVKPEMFHEIVRQTSEALNVLHSFGFMHRDIKPENILVFSLDPIDIKLCDFGHCCPISENMSGHTGTPSYQAPEILLRIPYNQSIDYWSLGSTLYSLFKAKLLEYHYPTTYKTMINRSEKVYLIPKSWSDKRNDEVTLERLEVKINTKWEEIRNLTKTIDSNELTSSIERCSNYCSVDSNNRKINSENISVLFRLFDTRIEGLPTSLMVGNEGHKFIIYSIFRKTYSPEVAKVLSDMFFRNETVELDESNFIFEISNSNVFISFDLTQEII